MRDAAAARADGLTTGEEERNKPTEDGVRKCVSLSSDRWYNEQEVGWEQLGDEHVSKAYHQDLQRGLSSGESKSENW